MSVLYCYFLFINSTSISYIFFFYLTFLFFFFFNDTATTEIYTLSLHDALPICRCHAVVCGCGRRHRGTRAQWRDGRARRIADGVSVRLPHAPGEPATPARRDPRGVPRGGRPGGNRARARRSGASGPRDRRVDADRRGARHRARSQDTARPHPHAIATHHAV